MSGAVSEITLQQGIALRLVACSCKYIWVKLGRAAKENRNFFKGSICDKFCAINLFFKSKILFYFDYKTQTDIKNG